MTCWWRRRMMGFVAVNYGLTTAHSRMVFSIWLPPAVTLCPTPCHFSFVPKHR
jgi:hypothetical protein